MRERGAEFGGETTGHLFFKDNYFADSALIAALVVMQALSETNKKLSEIVDEYRYYVMGPEINFEVQDKEKTLRKVSDTYPKDTQDWLDGLTVNLPDYWFNIRVSNTEPLIRLNVEAKTAKDRDIVVANLTELISSN
jgi:phosphomannomutase